MVLVVLRYCMTDVRDTTRSSEISARLVSMSSWMPSVKNPLSFSSLMLLNGRTARDFSLMTRAGGSVDLTAASAAGTTGVASDLAAGRTNTTAPQATAGTPAKPAAERDH